ncbi:hypothetical protein AX774_g6120 [Zancudomyces culisetae]|uniref:Uncharacterized protein n=1 Tax=Zancudomyces culisetae TaxID=1213189 RepID=A0A1R1PHI7_ZANCU|nr:hypothetical protein AX774_g7523 [Zancudomyces culisetae]OMH80441.1 hypothetical protein AX774_g6120 [Zancudomyces culisetae]|eukprot:OMH79073.1 hypothetical protein AX774_g7523 [Zancudomyces culisetae]
MDEKLDISTLIVLSAITVYCTHATQQLEASDSNTELALLLIDILVSIPNKSDGLENVCKSKSEGENDHGNDDLIERDNSTQSNILFHEHEFLELLEPHSSFSTYIFEQLERLDCVDMFIEFFKDSLFYPKIDDDKEEGSDRPVLFDEKEQPDFFLILVSVFFS